METQAPDLPACPEPSSEKPTTERQSTPPSTSCSALIPREPEAPAAAPKKTFKATLQSLSEAYGVELTKGQMKLYAIGLALLSEEDRQATLRWAVFERRERSSFMPTLPELLTYARRRHAERAWSAVIDSVYKHNVWEPKRRPKLGEAAAYALVMIGGWDVACDDQEDRRRLHRDFIDAYLRWQPELGDFSKCL